MKRMAGVLHECPSDGRKKFFNPNLFPVCCDCGENLTDKPIKIFDVCKSSKEPFTEKHMEEAKRLIFGRIEFTSPNTVCIVTSTCITTNEIQRLEWLGFDGIEIIPKDKFSTMVVLIWNKELPAEISEGTPI